MKNQEPFEITEEYAKEVSALLKPPHGGISHASIMAVLKANHEVKRRIVHDGGLEKWRNVYSFWIPGDVLLDMLRDIAWAKSNESDNYLPDLVQFHPTPPDTEDSYFQVLDNDGDLKDSLPEAIKKAYFRMRDDQKEERRREFLKLREEFEPNANASQD